MATCRKAVNDNNKILSVPDAGSDYGSDLDSEGEQELTNLLVCLETGAAVPLEVESLEIDFTEKLSSVRVPVGRSSGSSQRRDVDDGTDGPLEWRHREGDGSSQETFYDALASHDDIGML